MACCNPCCHGSACNIALRTLSLILGILAFCIHTAALGHTYWFCLKTGFGILSSCEVRMSLFHVFYQPFGTSVEALEPAWTKACAAFAVLAAGSSFMAFIFMCIRFCMVKKAVEYITLFFLFGAFGCEFLVWVIFVALKPAVGEKLNDKHLVTSDAYLGQGFGCSVASMVFSFLCFVMIAASVKITGPIVKNPKTVVVVNSQAGQQAVVVQDGQQVVMTGQQQQVQYAHQQPPAYGADETKQPGAY